MRMLVEFAEAQIAIGARRPRFSWEVPLAGRGRRQSAYQVLVASSEELLEPGEADLWDSGRVESSRSANIEYAGAELASNRDCFWKVGLWDEAGADVGFGPAARFGTPLYDESDWEARWIGMGDPAEPVPDPGSFPASMDAGETSASGSTDEELFKGLPPEIAAFEPDPRAPMMRKGFEVASAVKRARAFVCGLGLYELRLNGNKVGADVLATPRTDFRKRAFYTTHDITPLLKTGANAVGIVLGNGWFNGQKKFWKWQMPWFGSPRAILQIEIELGDGSVQRVVSDDSWQGAWSPVTANCIYDGEDYDARLEQPGWDAPGFNDASWQRVNVVPSPGGALAPIPHEQERIVETFRPVSMSGVEPGVFVFDMGRNMTGWARLKVRGGKAGETVTLRYGEAVHDSGAIDCSTAGGARQAEKYVMKGSGEESYEPRFTYHGFQYVELTGCPGTPDLDTLTGCFAHVAVERTGEFECANPLINRIHSCTVQSQRCNIQMGVVTDDTQRAERLGWCGDIWAMANEANYNLWMPRVWAKWVRDCMDQQDDLGMIGFIAPLPGPAEDLVWSAAFVIVPWLQYKHFGDRRILEESYPALVRYVDYLERTGTKELHALSSKELDRRLRWRCSDEDRFPSKEDHGYLQISRFGDHLATHEGGSGFGKSQPISIATAFYYYDVDLMRRIAEVLGHDDDAARYRELAAKIKDAFNKRFFNEAFGYYDVGAQSAQGWALSFGLVPEERRGGVASHLASSVNFRQRRLTTGYAGTKWAINAISEAGRDDVIWKRAVATDYPSWGFMLRDPKRTTITENWLGSASLCHTVLGAAIDEWFYWGLAGIRPDEAAPGYERVVIKPYLPPDLEWARASVRTIRGRVASEWRRDGDTARLNVTIPANSSAAVHVPSKDADKITEGDVPAAEAENVTLLRSEGTTAVFEIGSGEYAFEFPVR